MLEAVDEAVAVLAAGVDGAVAALEGLEGDRTEACGDADDCDGGPPGAGAASAGTTSPVSRRPDSAVVTIVVRPDDRDRLREWVMVMVIPVLPLLQ